MIPFTGVLIASGSGPTLPNSVVIGGNGSGSLTTSFSMNSDGTTTSKFTGAADVTGLWYSPAGGGYSPGAYYYVSFHKLSGTVWSVGLVDSAVYALTSDRTLSWTTSSGVVAIVTVSLWLDAGGTQSAGTFTLNMDIN